MEADLEQVVVGFPGNINLLGKHPGWWLSEIPWQPPKTLFSAVLMRAHTQGRCCPDLHPNDHCIRPNFQSVRLLQDPARQDKGECAHHRH